MEEWFTKQHEKEQALYDREISKQRGHRVEMNKRLKEILTLTVTLTVTLPFTLTVTLTVTLTLRI